MFLFYNRPFLYVCNLEENLLFFTLILGSVATMSSFTGISVYISSPKLTLFPLLTPTSTLPGPAPLKLRPYGAIQMCILLLLL